jgi:hypothetical protein
LHKGVVCEAEVHEEACGQACTINPVEKRLWCAAKRIKAKVRSDLMEHSNRHVVSLLHEIASVAAPQEHAVGAEFCCSLQFTILGTRHSNEVVSNAAS